MTNIDLCYVDLLKIFEVLASFKRARFACVFQKRLVKHLFGGITTNNVVSLVSNFCEYSPFPPTLMLQTVLSFFEPLESYSYVCIVILKLCFYLSFIKHRHESEV